MKTLLHTLAVLALFASVPSIAKAGAGCTGSPTCKVCSNCKYCAHCAKQGGTCGVNSPPPKPGTTTAHGTTDQTTTAKWNSSSDPMNPNRPSALDALKKRVAK